MKLVGKKLYRTGPLKLFKQKSASGNAQFSNPGRGGSGGSGPTEEEKRRQREFQEAMKKKAWLAEQAKQESAIEKKEWKDEASRELYDTEQKGIYEKQKALAEEQRGAAQQAGAERGLQAQMAAAGAGRGSAAQRMRGLARAGEAGTRAAAAMGAQSGAQQAKMLGAAGAGRFGMMKSDKAGKLGFYQKSRGLDVAEKAAAQQAAATARANSGGKASGGEIFKEFKRKNGKIEGPGTETSDSIKAMLSDGEFVVNAKTVRGLGEAMGAKGKEDSRKKGAGFLYDLQTKYGDKKPVNKAFGGLEIAELGAHAAKEGAFGKKMKTVGEVAGAAVDAKKGIDKKEKDRVKEETSGFAKQLAKGGDVKPLKPKSVVREGEFKPDPNTDPRDEKMKRSWSKFKKGGKFSDKERKSHLKMALDMIKAKKGDAKDLYKKMSGRGDYPKELVIGKAKGGHVNLGKGVKAKRKFREAIGWEADKIFDKKAEKDYKEGHTGYKNWKGDSVVKLGRGGLLGSIGRVGLGAVKGFVLGGGPTGAVMGAAKAGVSEKMAADKEKQQKKSNIAMGEAKSAAKQAEAGKALASDEIELKDGGEISKDHPHYKFLKDLQDWQEKRNRRGKKVDLDPGRKADKAIRAKKGSIEPIEMKEGGDWRKEIEDKITKKYGHVLNSKALRQRINKAIVSEKDFREGAEKTSALWNPQRIAAMKKDALKYKGKGLGIGDPSATGDRKPIKIKLPKKLDFKKMSKEAGKDLERIGREDKLRNKKRHRIGSSAQKLSDQDIADAYKRKKRKKEEDLILQHMQQKRKRVAERKKQEAAGLKHMQDRRRDREADLYDESVAKDLGMSVKDYRREMAEEAGVEGKGIRETKSLMAKPKEEKSWWGDMPDKDKAGIAMGVGKGLISARQAYLKEKQRRKEAIAQGELEAAKIRAAAGNQLIAAPVSLRKGGRVSFKDVLKAKKKMGY